MTIQTKPSAFMAIDPPKWMESDLRLAETKFKGITCAVIFTSDLPVGESHDDPKRIKALAGMLKDMWGYSPTETGYESKDLRDILTDNPFGICSANGRQFHGATSSMTRGFFTYTSRPTHCIVTLRSRHRTPQQSTSAFTQIDPALCENIEGAIPVRYTLWHEFGHLNQALQLNVNYTSRMSETGADIFSGQSCIGMGDSITASYGFDRHVLGTFRDPLHRDYEKFVPYWNALAQKRGILEHDELNAYAEVKARSLTVHTALRDKHLYVTCQTDPAYEAFRRLSADPSITTQSKIRQLAEHHDKPYLVPQSRELADLIITAATRLSPKVF